MIKYVGRSILDGKRIITIDEFAYKVSEPDHLGFCRVLEAIPSLENLRSFEKMMINSSYGSMHIDTTLKTFSL
jgi:hypothetical protein